MRDRDDLTGLNIPDELCSDCGQGTAFRGNDIRILPFADTQGLDSQGIPYSDQFARTCDYQAIGAFEL